MGLEVEGQWLAAHPQEAQLVRAGDVGAVVLAVRALGGAPVRDFQAWWSSRSAYLSGACPADVVATEPARVLHAAVRFWAPGPH